MSGGRRKPPPSARELRREAEDAVRRLSPDPPAAGESLSAQETEQLLHDLRVHQIELEMQNEQLRQSQADLERMRARLFDLYDLAPIGYCTLGPDAMLAQANLTAANLLGVARGELPGKSLSRFFLAEDADAFLVLLGQLMRTGEPGACELRLAGGGTPPRWLRVTAKAGAGEAGEPETWVTLNEITDAKRAESDRAVSAERLREAQGHQAIETLATGIAREFNNAFAIIKGNLQSAREDAGDRAPLVASLDEIDSAATRARSLVQRLLSFARRTPLPREATPLAAFVEASADRLRESVPEAIALETRCAPGVPPALVDAGQLSQALLNIVTNAVDAMAGRPGRISIVLDCVHVDAAMARSRAALHVLPEGVPGDFVRIKVIDDGPGMDVVTARRCFEPFFTTRRGDRSAGLGLSVARGIVAAMGGAIDLETRPGEGATFSLYLPAAPAAPADSAPAGAAAAPAAPAGPAPCGRHVLYVDDDSALVHLVRRRLERKGLRVSGFVDPLEALAVLATGPAAFDLLVTDYNMPRLSGIDVAREAHAIRPDLPVAIASGYIDETLRESAQQVGVHELVYKANTAEGFCDALLRLAAQVGKDPAPG